MNKITKHTKISQSGHEETKDLLTLATLTENGDSILLEVRVLGSETSGIYGGLRILNFNGCARRENGTVDVTGDGSSVELNTFGFGAFNIVTDGDDVKLQAGYSYPTGTQDLEVEVEWTIRQRST